MPANYSPYTLVDEDLGIIIDIALEGRGGLHSKGKDFDPDLEGTAICKAARALQGVNGALSGVEGFFPAKNSKEVPVDS